MQRKHLVILVLAVVILAVAFYIYIAKPVVTLPTVTVPLSPDSTISAYQRQLNVNELNVVVRTDGNLTVNADGQAIAQMKYTLGSVKNAIDLAEKTALDKTARTAVFLVPIFLPQFAWNVFIGSLSVYYTLPLQITVRFVPG